MQKPARTASLPSEKSGKSPPRDKLLTRWHQLKSERSSWDSHWQEVSDYILPRASRFEASDRNNGGRKHNNILDSTGTRAMRVLAAGLMAGMTSPARPWFRLTTSDPELDESSGVKLWLADVQRVMLMVFSKGNTYRALHAMYEELSVFGTGASIVLPDFNDVVRHYPLTTGEYCIATDYRGQVNTLYREFDKTVAELVSEFGYDNCSATVRNLYNSGNLGAWRTVVHAIEPRSDRDHTKSDAKNMAYTSCLFEQGGEDGKYLRESGFRRFPAVVPRWATFGGDIYGTSPAMEALGDIKQLQHQQLRKAQGIDYKVNPPLQKPTSMKNREGSTLPGGVSWYDQSTPTGGIRSAFDVNIDLSHLLMDIQDVRGRINSGFYADLFLMLAGTSSSNMTATEVAERHEEKLLMLGPVLERLHNELLDPLINITFDILLGSGVLPPPPPELEGRELNVEFVSMLAQAQKAVATNSIDRFVGNIGMVAQYKPEVLDKFDADRWADAYADMLGVDPELIVPGEQVAIVRQQRAQAAQQQQQAAMMEQQANAAKTMSQTDTSGDNALTNVMSAFSGYNT